MTRDDIIRMAQIVDLHLYGDAQEAGIERFFLAAAAAGADAEREHCANVCENTLSEYYMGQIIPERDKAFLLAACADCAAAIRARRNT